MYQLYYAIVLYACVHILLESDSLTLHVNLIEVTQVVSSTDRWFSPPIKLIAII
jgi:hypothetical protein